MSDQIDMTEADIVARFADYVIYDLVQALAAGSKEEALMREMAGEDGAVAKLAKLHQRARVAFASWEHVRGRYVPPAQPEPTKPTRKRAPKRARRQPESP